MREDIKLFESPLSYPDPDARRRLNALVGISTKRERLSKTLSLLLNPQPFEEWVKKTAPQSKAAISLVTDRPPLVVLAGDVGSGKTELAETIGEDIAKSEGIKIICFPLSLASRGQGMVGEMTTLISSAFDQIVDQASKYCSSSGKPRGGVLLLIDEADALAQSRENAQMHHEDRAGVNAFIRGVNNIGRAKIPAAVIICTNRLNSLDPAVRRRSAEIIIFGRPNDIERKEVFERFLSGMSFSSEQIEALIEMTGPRNNRKIGFTFSDITQRLIPQFLLDAYPGGKLQPERLLHLASEMLPTPPFEEKYE